MNILLVVGLILAEDSGVGAATASTSHSQRSGAGPEDGFHSGGDQPPLSTNDANQTKNMGHLITLATYAPYPRSGYAALTPGFTHHPAGSLLDCYLKFDCFRRTPSSSLNQWALDFQVCVRHIFRCFPLNSTRVTSNASSKA